MRVEIEHRKFGKVILENITEIHYNYRRTLGISGIMIAFESDIDHTGYTYDMEDIAEFEAILITGD